MAFEAAAAACSAAAAFAAAGPGDLKALQHALRSDRDESGICPHITICMSLLQTWSLLTRTRSPGAAAAKCDSSNSPSTKHGTCIMVMFILAANIKCHEPGIVGRIN
jgi:hypothetical protein